MCAGMAQQTEELRILGRQGTLKNHEAPSPIRDPRASSATWTQMLFNSGALGRTQPPRTTVYSVNKRLEKPPG